MNQNQVNLEPEEPLLPSPSSEMLAYMEKLYPLIFAFKQTKLWKSIRDSEPFAIQMPDGQTGCCILTGNEGILFPCPFILVMPAGTASAISTANR